MMRKGNYLVLLISLLAGICLSWCACPAQDTDEASALLCEYGISLYKQGQVEDAIHELKKALMINPHNTKAKNYLKKIYAEKGLPGEPLETAKKKIKSREYQDQIKKLREGARNYQKQINALKAQNQAKELQLQRLNRQLDLQKELFSKKEQGLLSAHKGRREKIAELQNQIKQLQKETSDYQKEATALNDQYLAKQSELEKLTRQIQDEKGRREKISDLQDRLNRMQKETNDYQKQLAALNSRYSTKETQLAKLQQELISQKELLEKKAQELLSAQREQKKYLADLAGKHKELAKLKISYETRLKKLEADLKAKQDEESILIQECQFTWIEGMLDEFKEEPGKLECDFDQDFISAPTLKLAEKQGVSSWETLNRELKVLMPSLESAFDDEDFFPAREDLPGFRDLETAEVKDMDMEEMSSDFDN